MTVRELFGDEGALVAGGLRGYRSWGSAGMGGSGRLSSVGVAHQWRRQPWEHPELARCLGGTCGGERSPGRRCSCGIYGWYRPDDQRLVPGALFGAVEATGRVILGSHGFRAEKVRVLGVTSIYPILQAVAAEHGYPVFESRQELLEAWPPDDVSGLVQHSCAGPYCAGDTLNSDRITRFGDRVTDALLRGADLALVGARMALRLGRVLVEPEPSWDTAQRTTPPRAGGVMSETTPEDTTDGTTEDGGQGASQGNRGGATRGRDRAEQVQARNAERPREDEGDGDAAAEDTAGQ